MKIIIDEQKICSLVRDYVESMTELMQEQRVIRIAANHDGDEAFVEVHLGEIDSIAGFDSGLRNIEYNVTLPERREKHD